MPGFKTKGGICFFFFYYFFCITLFRSITLFFRTENIQSECGQYLKILRGILSVAQNIVMDLNNVMCVIFLLWFKPTSTLLPSYVSLYGLLVITPALSTGLRFYITTCIGSGRYQTRTWRLNLECQNYTWRLNFELSLETVLNNLSKDQIFSIKTCIWFDKFSSMILAAIWICM